MKKTSFLTIVVLISVFSLSATSNGIGVQGLLWTSEQTLTLDDGVTNTSTSAKGKGMGIIVAGSYYPSIGSSFGLGYQLGATSTKEITTGGMTSTPDGPLTWRGGITGQYRTDVSPLLGIEIGAGLLFERAKDSDSSSGTLITMTVSDINLLTSATLLVNLTDDFSLVGGIDLALPLYASIKIRSGGLMVQPDVKVKGSAFQGRLGVVFNI